MNDEGVTLSVVGGIVSVIPMGTEFTVLEPAIVAVVLPALEPGVKVIWHEPFGSKTEGQLLDTIMPRVGEFNVASTLFAFALPILVTATLCAAPP